MKFKAEERNICLHNKEELYHGALRQKAALVLAELKMNQKNHMDGESIQSDSVEVKIIYKLISNALHWRRNSTRKKPILSKAS